MSALHCSPSMQQSARVSYDVPAPVACRDLVAAGAPLLRPHFRRRHSVIRAACAPAAPVESCSLALQPRPVELPALPAPWTLGARLPALPVAPQAAKPSSAASLRGSAGPFPLHAAKSSAAPQVLPTFETKASAVAELPPPRSRWRCLLRLRGWAVSRVLVSARCRDWAPAAAKALVACFSAPEDLAQAGRSPATARSKFGASHHKGTNYLLRGTHCVLGRCRVTGCRRVFRTG